MHTCLNYPNDPWTVKGAPHHSLSVKDKPHRASKSSVVEMQCVRIESAGKAAEEA